MRIPPWSPQAAARDPKLVEAIAARRGGKLLNLDLALLWSEPLARGWNAFLGAVRRELALDARVREIAICSVARITGAEYEFAHHWPEYVKAGGDDRLRAKLEDPARASRDPAFDEAERLAMRYAIAMTRDVKVPGDLFAEVRARWSETEVVELTAAIACYNMVARLLVALEVENEKR
ncbi:MAG TPA: carboxymuconolactone decarboxylase family protein [Usitatibacter sp.]|nr:carboxymuconolactone decarboxylase family protein [Usitatibacter sp.]